MPASARRRIGDRFIVGVGRPGRPPPDAWLFSHRAPIEEAGEILRPFQATAGQPADRTSGTKHQPARSEGLQGGLDRGPQIIGRPAVPSGFRSRPGESAEDDWPGRAFEYLTPPRVEENWEYARLTRRVGNKRLVRVAVDGTARVDAGRPSVHCGETHRTATVHRSMRSQSRSRPIPGLAGGWA